MNQLTLKSQEALQSAQQYAFEKNHPQIENEHLLHGLIETDTSVIPYLFNKLNLNLELIKSLNEKHLNSLPTVKGGNQVFSQSTSQTLMGALALAKKQHDDYVTTEHLIVSLLDSKSTAAKLLADQGMQKKTLEAAIQELRKGEKNHLAFGGRQLQCSIEIRKKFKRTCSGK